MNPPLDQRLLRRLVTALPDLFASHGLDARIEPIARGSLRQADAVLDLEGEGIRLEVGIDVHRRIDGETLAHEEAIDDPLRARLLVAAKFTRTAREQLRARNQNHADLTGAIFLRAPGVRIDVEGRGRINVENIQGDKQRINPFSKKASHIIRLLFEHHGESLGTGEMVSRTSLSRAWVFAVTKELTARGYATADDRGCRLTNPVNLLRDWMTEYTWKQNVRRTFTIPFAYHEIPERLASAFGASEVKWALTLLSGAQRRVGYAEYTGDIHAYAIAPGEASLNAALDALYAVPAPDNGNLVLMAPPYYGDAVFVGVQEQSTPPIVSDVQLLLDLAHYPVRGPEMAEVLVRSRLAKALELSAVDVSRLVENFR